MKIGYLTPEFPGQTHTFVWREISHLREWGVDISIFSTRQPDAITRARHEFAEKAAQETYYLWPQSLTYLLSTFIWAIFNYPSGFARMLQLCFTLKLEDKAAWRKTLLLLPMASVLAREVLRQGVSHLNCQSAANSAILCMLVKRLIGIPFSLVCNANLEWWGGGMSQKLSEAEFTVAVADWLFEQIRSEYPELKSQQVIAAHHGVDTEKWRSDRALPRHQNDRGEDDTFKIVTVGRLHSSKGHDFLIKSVKLLVNEGRKIDLKIIGSGPAKDSLASLIKELGISDSVALEGSLSEDAIIDIMLESDIFVLASHAEPLGVVYMEAMSMGIPTIGTNSGGVPEIITHHVDGLLVHPKDEIALKEAIKRLMNDPELRQTLSINGRKKVVEQFDSRIGAKMLYERLYNAAPLLTGNPRQ